MFNNRSFNPLYILWLPVVLLGLVITAIVGHGTAQASPNVALVDTDKVILEKAMYTGQGITTDGKYYYTSGSMTALNMTGLAKWSADDFKLVKNRLGVIPEEYMEKYDSNHVGGISYYNGLIYASVENSSKDHPLVITYDCETLEAVKVYELPVDILPNGIPWCAVDGKNGYLYCSPFRDVEKIAAFDLETMQFQRYIELSEEVTRIQGGEVYGDTLYLSSDNGENTDTICCIDVSSGSSNGNVSVLCERTIPGLNGNEAEGLTVCPMPDGSLIHVIDYDRIVGIYIRHYAVEEK